MDITTLTRMEMNIGDFTDEELEEFLKTPGRYLPPRRNWNFDYPQISQPKQVPKIFGTEVNLNVYKMLSSTAIIRYQDRLSGMEDYPKKLMCLYRRFGLRNTRSGLRNTATLLSFSANYQGKMQKPLASSFPSLISNLTCCGCAVWGSSKIIIAGGKCEEVPSPKVFIYDTVTKTIDASLLMIAKRRSESPTVVVANDKIFIFGGGGIDPWAEFCDLDSNNTSLVPLFFNSPDEFKFSKIISHAVYPNGNQILFWLDTCVVMSFDYCKFDWEKYDKHMAIARGLQCSSMVVFEDFLFWHCHGTLYAHDLLSKVTIPMHTLPRSDFSSALFSGDVPPPTFLVYLGLGSLSLIYQEDNKFRYITFLLQVSQGAGPAIPHIVVGCSGFLKTPPVTDVNHILEIFT